MMKLKTIIASTFLPSLILMLLLISNSPMANQNHEQETANPDLAMMNYCYNYSVHPTPKAYTMPKCHYKNKILYWDGAIDISLFYHLKYVYPNTARLELNSYGGNSLDSFEIAKLVREMNLTTSVRQNAVCMSACTVIYQAGIKRVAHDTALFMYHPGHIGRGWHTEWIDQCYKQGREVCRKTLVEYIENTQKITSYHFHLLEVYGASKDFATDFQKTPMDPDWFYRGNFSRFDDLYLKAGELLQYNIVQQLE